MAPFIALFEGGMNGHVIAKRLPPSSVHPLSRKWPGNLENWYTHLLDIYTKNVGNYFIRVMTWPNKLENDQHWKIEAPHP